MVVVFVNCFFGGETEKEIFVILPQATTSYPQHPKPTPLWICGWGAYEICQRWCFESFNWILSGVFRDLLFIIERAHSREL